MLRELWRSFLLWKSSRYSKILLASSILVRQRCLLSSSTCILAQNASIIALSYGEPTAPIEGASPAVRTFSLKAQEVNWADSTGGRNGLQWKGS